MTTMELMVSAMGLLTPYGVGIDALRRGLANNESGLTLAPLPPGSRPASSPLGCLGDFSEELALFVKPNLRRKMTRFSRMSVLAAGLALQSAGLPAGDHETTGVSFATAFGSTGQSETFFLDFLEHGPATVNPGLFPETVPNAPAGQISIAFGLRGPSLTLCQQHLSAELALWQAREMLLSGMAERMLVVSVEELCPALLQGFSALGILKKPTEYGPEGVRLSPRTVVGEAAIALLLETPEALARRGGASLARLVDLELAGGGLWPARFPRAGQALRSALAGLAVRQPLTPEAVVASGTYIERVDRLHLHTLAETLAGNTPLLVPEYGTGSLLGAGLLRTATSVLLLAGAELPASLLASPLPASVQPGRLFTDSCRNPAQVLTSTLSAGDGAALALLAR